MCVVGPDTKVKWHTTLGKGQVLEGLEPDSAIVEEGTADVVAALIAMVEAQTEAVAAEGDKQIKAVQTATKTAQDSAVAEIEAKRTNSLNSIPGDYTAMQSAVDGLTRNKGTAIICESAGPAITINDASNMAMQGLRIFGRSTQDGVPAPDAPVEIKSVENPVVTVTGRNLLALPYRDGVSKNHGGVTYTVNPDGSVHAVGTVTATSSHFILNAVDFGEQNISEGFSNGKYHWTDCLYNGSNKYTMIYLVKGVEVDKTFYPRVSLGTAPSEFETPREVQAVETTHPLRGIPVATGGNYTDENGQQWICDEVDLERGVYVQRIKHMILPSTFIINASTNEMWVQLNSNDTAAYSLDEKQCYCTHYPGVSRQEIYNNAFKEGFRAICLRDTVVRIVDNVLFNGNPSAFNAWIAEKAASGENVGVSYILNNPVETPLSETEIAAYRSLHTNKPNTTILNDSGAHMSVEYAAYTKLYIDNLIKNL
jgi:hypothetical protein